MLPGNGWEPSVREEEVSGVPGVPDMLPSNSWEPSVREEEASGVPVVCDV